MTVGARQFYRKWMKDIEDCQDRISGNVQYTAPYTHSGGGPGVRAVVAYAPRQRAFVAVALTGDGSAEAAANLLLKALAEP